MKTEELVQQSLMFPCHEISQTFDDYGANIDQRDYMDEGQLELDRSAAAVSQQWEAKDMQVDVLPTKCVTVTQEVKLHCTMKFIDFEGRYDGNDLMNILRHLRPHKLLIVHGDRGSSEHLAARACEGERVDKRAVESPDDVFAPTARPQVTVDVTSDRLVFKAKMADALYDTVDFYQIGDYEVGHIDAVVRDKPAEDDDSAGAGERTVWLDLPPEDKRGKGHAVTMVGDLKLLTIATKLQDAGIEAVFRSGILVCCEDRVMLRKSQTGDGGKIEMEGALCAEYYHIRDLLYQGASLLW
jgi:hypothetical protein